MNTLSLRVSFPLVLLALLLTLPRETAALERIKLPDAPYTLKVAASVRSALFANIAGPGNPFAGAGGSPAAIPGAIRASTSFKGSPPGFAQDYLFDWVRDSAITMLAVASVHDSDPALREECLGHMKNYVSFARKAQAQVAQASDCSYAAAKYRLDGTMVPLNEWGPQSDGPALRALALMRLYGPLTASAPEYADMLYRNTLDPRSMGLIKRDLEFVANHWRCVTRDPWEELDNVHFFNLAVQRAAMLRGGLFARSRGDEGAAGHYLKVYGDISRELASYWNAKGEFFTSVKAGPGEQDGADHKGGGLNTSVVLGLLLGDVQPEAASHSLPADPDLDPASAKSMSTAFLVRSSFCRLYRVNLEQDMGARCLYIGRYPSDLYDGQGFVMGNPWQLASNAFAQYYYTVASRLMDEGSLTLDDTNGFFLRSIHPKIAPAAFGGGPVTRPLRGIEFAQVIRALLAQGDELMLAVKAAGKDPATGEIRFSEQIDRQTGRQASAENLTWSHASVLTALEARAGLMRRIERAFMASPEYRDLFVQQ